MATKKKRNVVLSVLPGEPLDGTGRVCVHLFVKDSAGLFIEPHALHPVIENGIAVGKLEAKPTRGRLACDPKRPLKVVNRNGEMYITMRTDDARAVTCPKCKTTAEYISTMASYVVSDGVN